MTDLEKARLELEQARKEELLAEHQLTKSENRVNTALRKQSKARTHRLIVEGAELEYVFDGIEDLPAERYREFMGRLAALPEVMELYVSYSSSNGIAEDTACPGKKGDGRPLRSDHNRSLQTCVKTWNRRY